MINYENLLPENDYLYYEIDKKNIIKIYINARVIGRIGKDTDILISSYNKNNEYFSFYLEKKDGKKNMMVPRFLKLIL